MATWNGTPVEFNDWHTDYRDEKPFVNWSYNTTSDFLRIITEYPKGFCSYSGNKTDARRIEISLDPSEAEAMILSLLQWDERFNDGSIQRKHKETLVD